MRHRPSKCIAIAESSAVWSKTEFRGRAVKPMAAEFDVWLTSPELRSSNSELSQARTPRNERNAHIPKPGKAICWVPCASPSPHPWSSSPVQESSLRLPNFESTAGALLRAREGSDVGWVGSKPFLQYVSGKNMYGEYGDLFSTHFIESVVPYLQFHLARRRQSKQAKQ